MVLIPSGEFLTGITNEQVAAANRVADEAQGDIAAVDRIKNAERPQRKFILTTPLLSDAALVRYPDRCRISHGL
jgi:hypothetical protein